MARYRATFRFGADRPMYEMVDVVADDLRGALKAAADEVRAEVIETAELVEIRRQLDPEEREYTPE